MNKITDISPYLTESSRPLWEKLNSIYKITVCPNDLNEYCIYSEGDNVTIFVDSTQRPCAASFAHELLHLLIRSTQTYIGSTITLIVRESPDLRQIMTDGLLQHIGNCLDHAKMLPLYLEMGFDRTLFIKDYATPKLTVEELKNIQQRFCRKYIFRKTSYNPAIIDCYIGKYFAVKACPNNTIDYSYLLYELKDVNQDLWQILDDFWRRWMEYDIFKQRKVFEENYSTLGYEFTENIKKWLAHKTLKMI